MPKPKITGLEAASNAVPKSEIDQRQAECEHKENGKEKKSGVMGKWGLIRANFGSIFVQRKRHRSGPKLKVSQVYNYPN